MLRRTKIAAGSSLLLLLALPLSCALVFEEVADESASSASSTASGVGAGGASGGASATVGTGGAAGGGGGAGGVGGAACVLPPGTAVVSHEMVCVGERVAVGPTRVFVVRGMACPDTPAGASIISFAKLDFEAAASDPVGLLSNVGEGLAASSDV